MIRPPRFRQITTRTLDEPVGSPFIPGCLLWRHALPAPAPVLAIAALAMGIPLWYADLPYEDASKIQQPRRAKLVWSITSAMTPLRGDGAKYEAQPKRGCDCREIVPGGGHVAAV